MPLPIMLAHKHRQAARRGAQGRRAPVPAPGRQGAGDGPLRGRRARPPDARSRSSACSISTQHREGLDAETMIKPDLIEHVLAPDPAAATSTTRSSLDDPDFVYVNPTGKFVIGGPMGDTGPDRPQDHRRHLRRRGAARRRRVLGQGPDEGRPLGRLRRALRREEHRRRRARRPLPDPGRLRDRRRAPVLDPRRDASAPSSVPVDADRGARPRALRPAPGRDPARPRPAPPDLREDRRVRPLRPRRPRLHVGAHRQGRRAPRGRRRSPRRATA